MEEENRRSFMNIGFFILPLSHRTCFDPFSGTRNVYGQAKSGIGMAVFKYGFDELVISVRRFNKELGTIFPGGF